MCHPYWSMCAARLSPALVLWLATAGMAGQGSVSSDDGAAGGTPLRRQTVYRGLWPFYTYEEYEDGAQRSRSFFGVLKIDREPNGDSHHHVLPFYCTSLRDNGRDQTLTLFPLLYSGRSSPERGHQIVFPLFYHWRRDDARHTLLWPLVQAARDPQQTPFRYVPVLFRHGSWNDGERSRQRLGLPWILELFEHDRVPQRESWTLLNLFNFDRETRSGLPMAKLSFSRESDYEAHLFPFFWAEREEPRAAEMGSLQGAGKSTFVSLLYGTWRRGEHLRGHVLPWSLTWWYTSKDRYSVDVLWPLVHFREEPGERQTRILPFYFASDSDLLPRKVRFYSLFYGRIEEDSPTTRTDHYYPLLLAHHGRYVNGHAWDLLWPLGHYSRQGEGAWALRALPFYDRKRSEKGDWLGVGGILYRRHESFDEKSRSHWVLFPLVHWKKAPERAVSWALPLFYSGSREDPYHSGHTTWVLPSYLSYSLERTWDTGETEVRIEESGTHLWPLFGRHESDRTWTDAETGEPQREWSRTLSSLYPLFTVGKTRSDGDPSTDETRIHCPWPLIRHRYDARSWDFRAFPVLFFGSHEQRDYTTLYPLLSVEEGDDARSGFGHVTSLVQWYGGRDRSTFHLFPLVFRWSRRGDDELSITSLFYLSHYSAKPERGWFHLLPLGFGSWRGDQVSFGVFPLYLQRDHGREKIDYWNPARFFFLWNTFRGADEFHWSLLWKLIQRNSRTGGDYDFRILHRLVVVRDVEEQYELTFNPFFSYSSDARTGDGSFSIFKFLYRSDTQDGENLKRVLFIPIARSKVTQ